METAIGGQAGTSFMGGSQVRMCVWVGVCVSVCVCLCVCVCVCNKTPGLPVYMKVCSQQRSDFGLNIINSLNS